jgi:hypothetical protein
MGDAERFGIAGLFRVVEATYGRPLDGGHGWHLHVHALLFSTRELGVGLVSDIGTVLGTAIDRNWLARNVFASRSYQRDGPRENNRLHHVGLSKHLRGTTVTVLADDRDIRVLHRDTGTLIRKLVLDPAASNAKTPETGCRCKPCLGTPVNDVPRHDSVCPGGIEPRRLRPQECLTARRQPITYVEADGQT